jgi:hypothetical protein
MNSSSSGISSCLAVFFLLSFYFGLFSIEALIGAVSVYLAFELAVHATGARFLSPFGFWLVVIWLLVF